MRRILRRPGHGVQVFQANSYRVRILLGVLRAATTYVERPVFVGTTSTHLFHGGVRGSVLVVQLSTGLKWCIWSALRGPIRQCCPGPERTANSYRQADLRVYSFHLVRWRKHKRTGANLSTGVVSEK